MPTITLLDDRTRPKAPKIEGITPLQRIQGQRLAYIHQMHLRELDQTRRLMEQIEAGEEQLARLAEAIPALQMSRSYQAFGNLCGRECQHLSFHHTAEDTGIFPALKAQGSEGLRRVVDRLADEHLVVHALIDALEAGAIKAIREPGPESFAELKETFRLLDRVVRSHFLYEQTELEEALGVHEVDL